jgi:hypothetical protein
MTTTSLDLNTLDALSASLDLDIEVAALEEAERAAEIAAQAAANPAPAQAPATPDAEPEELVMPSHVPGVLKDMASNITAQQITVMTDAVNAEFAGRIAFEQSMPTISSKMVPNLEAAQKRMTSESAVRAFCAMDIDPGFLNREVNTGTRFNVYALEKINDLVVGLTAGFVKNAINRAMLLSLFRFQEAGVPFTGSAAAAAVSDKIKIDRKTGALLTRHTASPSTAPTQKSQVMNSLQVLGIVTSNRLKGDNEVFTLTDTPQTRALKEALLPTT